MARTGRRLTWQRVVNARRLYLKGDGWWEIQLECGHQCAVLHGGHSPLGELCHCTYRCGEGPESVDAVDPSAADPGTLPTREKSS
jgi:hypothetical protein